MVFMNPSSSIVYSAFLLGSIYLNAVSLTQLNKILMTPKNELEPRKCIFPVILNGVVFVGSGFCFLLYCDKTLNHLLF